jgi:hypothetical protein
MGQTSKTYKICKISKINKTSKIMPIFFLLQVQDLREGSRSSDLSGKEKDQSQLPESLWSAIAVLVEDTRVPRVTGFTKRSGRSPWRN